MVNRLSVQTKQEIVNLFIGHNYSIDEISKKFKCTSITIKRNLKKELGNEKYKEIIDLRKSKKNQETFDNEIKFDNVQNKAKSLSNEESQFNFIELAPLDYEIDNVPRKEISSVPIEEIEFPNIVYMIVDKNIELEIKYLKDYPDWNFLSPDELNRKTIEIHFDIKNAKRFCKKDQKVIKVPNTDVFRIAATILTSKGISRIVSPDKLISL